MAGELGARREDIPASVPSPTTRNFTAEAAENAENSTKQGERQKDNGRPPQQDPKEFAVLGVLRDLCGEKVALSC